MGLRETDPLLQLSLPPGFRFYPTDEELLVQYLSRKVAGHHFSLQIIGEINLYSFDPWDLPGKALFGEKEWYFFSPRDRKYPNGSRPNRVAGSGYWKATGTDKMIASEGRRVGIKKALVFYVGKAPKGTKTNWIMHEFRLSHPPPKKLGSLKLDEWVLCRIYEKNSSAQKAAAAATASGASQLSSPSQYDDVMDSFPDIDDSLFSLPRMNSLKSLQQLGSGNFDWATLAGLKPLPEPSKNLMGLSQAQADQPRHGRHSIGVAGDMQVPSLPQFGGKGAVDEGVQSWGAFHRMARPGSYPESAGWDLGSG